MNHIQCYLYSSVILGLVHLLLTTTATTKVRGLAWNMGTRDDQPQPLHGKTGRLARSFENFKETFVFYVALSLLVIFMQIDNSYARTGAALYFWSRLTYIPMYIFGFKPWRTLVWGVSLFGIVLLMLSLR